jgi:glycosyltransferase involved in cell wall biosynthesis
MTSPSRVRLSAAVIAMNEEDKIGACLDSLSFADEIVVVDSGSTDRTVEIARLKGAKVVHHDWEGHIQQKNFAITQTTGEWVLSLDADERVSARLRGEILRVLENPAADGYAIPRLVFYMNRWIRRCGWYPERKTRLFRRGLGTWAGENPHDRLDVAGRVGNLDGDIYHLSFDSISDHLRTIDNFTEIAARERVAKGERAGMVSILLRPPATFVKMYFLKLGFLDGAPGFVASGLSAYHVFCKYVKIREMSRR